MTDTEIKCSSKVHRTETVPVADFAYIYHDTSTNGGILTLPNPETLESGAYGTETAFLCATCAELANNHPPQATTLLRVIAL